MLLVQGLREMTTVVKHAIEDYALHLYRDVVGEITNAISMCPQLMVMDALERYVHKKLALLVALKLCYTRVGKLFLRSIDDSRLDEPVQVCGGLRALRDIVVNVLSM